MVERGRRPVDLMCASEVAHETKNAGPRAPVQVVVKPCVHCVASALERSGLIATSVALRSRLCTLVVGGKSLLFLPPYPLCTLHPIPHSYATPCFMPFGCVCLEGRGEYREGRGRGICERLLFPPPPSTVNEWTVVAVGGDTR